MIKKSKRESDRIPEFIIKCQNTFLQRAHSGQAKRPRAKSKGQVARGKWQVAFGATGRWTHLINEIIFKSSAHLIKAPRSGDAICLSVSRRPLGLRHLFCPSLDLMPALFHAPAAVGQGQTVAASKWQPQQCPAVTGVGLAHNVIANGRNDCASCCRFVLLLLLLFLLLLWPFVRFIIHLL